MIQTDLARFDAARQVFWTVAWRDRRTRQNRWGQRQCWLWPEQLARAIVYEHDCRAVGVADGLCRFGYNKKLSFPKVRVRSWVYQEADVHQATGLGGWQYNLRPICWQSEAGFKFEAGNRKKWQS